MLKLKSLNNAKGFTKEQQTQIINELLEIINNNSNIGEIEKNIINLFNNDFKRALKEDKKYILSNLYIIGSNEAEKEITINVINSNCKFILINSFNNIIDFIVKKMKANIIITFIKNKTEHKNAVTGHIYKGNNAILLDKAMKENNYTTSEWVGSTQAKKLGKQIKNNAKAVEIKVFYEKETKNENKDFFMKVDKVYNVAELENIKKIEETNSYIEMIKELRKAG